MTIVLAGSSAVQSGTAASVTLTWPGSPSSQLLVAVFGIEGVSGAGPFVADAGLSAGWYRAAYQGPSASGSAVEVWYGPHWGAGATTTFNFSASSTFVARGSVYTGHLADTTAVRATATRQVTGAAPSAPSIYAYVGEMVLVACAEKLASPGFGTPAGYTQAWDSPRGSFGNVEATLAGALVTSEGSTGLITWASAVSAGGSDKGASVTLAIRPAAAVVAATSPLIAVEYAVTV